MKREKYTYVKTTSEALNRCACALYNRQTRVTINKTSVNIKSRKVNCKLDMADVFHGYQKVEEDNLRLAELMRRSDDLIRHFRSRRF